jgi:hypothetical protein
MMRMALSLRSVVSSACAGVLLVLAGCAAKTPPGATATAVTDLNPSAAPAASVSPKPSDSDDWRRPAETPKWVVSDYTGKLVGQTVWSRSPRSA